jgi:hypothetical protein
MRTSWLMVGLAIVFVCALAADTRLVDGARAWLKPAKFAVSLAIYGFTLAWMLSLLSTWPRLVGWGAWTTTVAAVVEMGLIAMQAGRGVGSHFNTSTTFDGAVFAIMGLAITIQTLSAGLVAVAMWRHSFPDRALGWALRLGLTITVLGSSAGGLMARPTAMQSAEERATGKMPRTGSHSIGGQDGGPGLPALRWSTEHGDIRVAHFVGLHAMQVLPIVAFITRGRMSGRMRVRIVVGAGVSFGVLFALLLTQALAGQPVTAPTGWMLVALALWLVATAALAVLGWHASRGVVTCLPRSVSEQP